MRSSTTAAFEAHNVQELMGKENFVGGRRFSDVTNSGLSLHSSRIKNLDNLHREDFDRTQHLQQEIACLKKQLTEKEVILQYTRHELHKVLQDKNKASQQNLQLARTNGQMFSLKLLQHDYNQMSAMFKVKTTELEQKVSDLSKQLQDKHRIGTKEPDRIENTVQAPPKCLRFKENRNCAFQRLGWELIGEKSSKIKLSADEEVNGKRVCTSRSLVSSRESKLATNCRQERKTVFTPMLNQIDQSDAAFNAGDLSNEVNSSSRENESINEEALNVNRVLTGRCLTSGRDSKLATKRRQERKTVSTRMMNQIDQNSFSFSAPDTLEGVCAGDLPNEVNSSLRANGSINAEASNLNRVCSGRRLTSSRESKLTTKCTQKGKTILTPTLNQIDQSKASFCAPETLEEACAGDLPNEVNSTSRANGSTNEEASNVNSAYLGRPCTDIQDKGPSLHAMSGQEEKAVFTSTLTQIERNGDSIGGLETTLQKICADNIYTEASCSSTSSRSANEEASNGKRTSSRRRSANICYKEPSLIKKLRQQGQAVSTPKLFRKASNGKRTSLRRRSANICYKEPSLIKKLRPRQQGQAVSTQKLFRNDQHRVPFSDLEILGVYKGDITNEADNSSKINVTSNRENRKVKRLRLRRHSANVTDRDSDPNGNYKQEEETVLTPRFCESDQCSTLFSELETLEKVSEYDIACNMFTEPNCSSTANRSANEEASNGKRVCLRRHSANVTDRDSNLNGNYKQEEETILTPRFCESDQCSTSFSGLETLEKVSEDEELHIQDKEVASETLERHQSCVFPTTEGKSCRASRVKHQQQVQGIASCQGSSLNAALEPTEMSRKSLAGRPVRKAVEGIASYKEVPLKFKMRRSE